MIQDQDRPIACFSHVQKAGGTTVEAVMRRHFGARHMLVDPPRGWIYRKHDLTADLRLNPWTKSICGHWLRPFVNFGEFEPRLLWYVFLREPVSRFLSHYHYHAEQMGVSTPFRTWSRSRIQHNWQTQYLAGEQDLEAAKQILADRYKAVGLLEDFDRSLLLVRRALGLEALDIWYGRPHNAAKNGSRREPLDREVQELCLEYNRLDIELYRFASEELYPRQISAYGEARLEADLQAALTGRTSEMATSRRDLEYLIFRRAIHLPVRQVRRGLARMSRLPDERR